jgi:hypothetical protein
MRPLNYVRAIVIESEAKQSAKDEHGQQIASPR